MQNASCTGGSDPQHGDSEYRPRHARPRFSDQQVAQAQKFVEDSQVVPVLERALAARRRSNAGRPRTVTVQALFTGMQLCAVHYHGRVVLMTVAEILAHGLPQSVHAAFGLPTWPDSPRGFERCYAAVRAIFHDVEALLDPSPLPKRRLPRDQALLMAGAVDRHVAEQKLSLQILVTNLLVEASLLPVRPLLDQVWDGSVAVDATPIRTFSRGVGPRSPMTATDPDAAWYTRQGDHRDPAERPSARGPKSRKRGERHLFGYEATFVVAANAVPPPTGAYVPALILAMVIHKPGHAPGPNALRALRDVARRGYRPGHLAGDRAYNNSEETEFQIPVLELGYLPVYDYRVDQLGQQGEYAGARQVDGGWYCPQMPQPLVTATLDLLEERIDQHTWHARIAARTPYRLRHKQLPVPGGPRRMLCPAAGQSPRVACPLKRASLGGRGDPRRILIDIQPVPTGHPLICRRQSVSFPPHVGAKHGQAHAHGTRPWITTYFHLRNCVESVNGFAKSREAIERSVTRCVRGGAAQALLLAFQIAHANQRKIDGWLDTRPVPGHQPRRRPSDRYRPKDPDLWTPTGYIPQTPDTPEEPPTGN